MISDTKGLSKNIKNDVDEFEITLGLKNNVFEFKTKTSKISSWAWGIAITSIGAVVAFYITTPSAVVSTAGSGGVISFGAETATATGAMTILGINATIFAISLGVAAEGIGVIANLKNQYDVIECNGRYFMKKM